MKLLLALSFFIIVFFISYNKGLNSNNALPGRSFNYFTSKDNFKSFYKDKVNLKTGIEEQRSILLTNIYNAQNFLARLNVSYTIINRDEMKEIADDLKIDTFEGLYNTKTNEIYIVDYDKDTSIHELGHVIYQQLLSNKERKLSSKYFKSESSKLIDEYGKESEKEFFAVAFTEYIYSPDTLKANCPNIYKLINDIDNNIK